MSQPRFAQARLKHVWANKHIHKLHAVWEAFLKTDFCEVRVEVRPDGFQSFRVVSVVPVPADIRLLMGDIVHNLRCALDYAVSELLGWQDKRLTFPMGEERKELISSFRTDTEIIGGKSKKRGRNAAIEQAVPGIGRFIVDEVRAYRHAEGLVWALGKLDATDKHRLLLTIIVPQTLTEINIHRKNEPFMTNAVVRFDANGVGDFLGTNLSGLQVVSYGKPTAEIFLHETGIIEGQPLFPTLVQLSQAVAETLDRLDEFVSAAGN